MKNIIRGKISCKDYTPFIDVKMKYFSWPQPVDTSYPRGIIH